MGSVTDIKFVLTQKVLDTFCKTFHIPDEVHPQLPGPNQTIHEMPTGKIGVYTSRNYTLDEDTYPTFLHDDGTEMDLLAFIHVVDPTKVKVGERECAKEEARLLDSTVGCVVPLLPIASARAESEFEASVDKLFDESSGADQGDSAGGGGQETTAEAAADASGSSHHLKKLRSDHGTSGGAASAGKSSTVLKQLLASSILNVESGVGAAILFPLSPLPFLSVVVPPVMTEVVITTHVASIPSAVAPEPGTKVITPVHASMFHDSESTGKSLHEVFVPRWNIPNDSLLDDLNAFKEFIDHLAPPILFAHIRFY
ncbi:hypothetical protein Tco_0827079 [Tanacetum coccineum]